MRRLLRVVLQKLGAQRLLTIYVVLLCAIPSRLVFVPLGGAGSPQELFGLVLLEIWIVSRFLNKPRARRLSQPVRTAYLAMLTIFTLSFIAAMSRPIDNAESSTAIQAFLLLFSWGGVLLFASDLIPNQRVLDTLLRRIVFVGGLMAALAMVQFVTGQLLIDKIWFPGLAANANQHLAAITERGGLNRPASTAIHPIEFGAVITMILPVALTLAVNDRSRSFVRRWTPVVLIAFAVFMSVSRSALVSTAFAMFVLVLAWTWKHRLRAMGAGVTFLGVIALVIPGMLGTLLGLFTSIGAGDTSAASRTASFPIAYAFFDRSPWVGRGFGTFLPSLHILDNALLGLLIEVGVLGLGAMVILLFTGMAAGQTVRRHGVTHQTRQLGHALTASLVGGSVGLGLYDGFGFPMGAAMIFLFLGLAGAARRIALRDEGREPDERSTLDARVAVPRTAHPMVL